MEKRSKRMRDFTGKHEAAEIDRAGRSVATPCMDGHHQNWHASTRMITMHAMQSRSLAMASLTIRNIDDELKQRLRLQAARHGASMEQEVRDILRRAIEAPQDGSSFAQKIQQRFAGLNAENLPIPPRRAARVPKAPTR
jgi:plasmid stability protein